MDSNKRRRVAADKRKRTESSCDTCKARKQKCDQQANQTRCRYCLAHDIQCETTQPRKKRLYGSLENVGTRLQLLEALAKGLVPEADLSSNDELRRVGDSLGIPLPLPDWNNDQSPRQVDKAIDLLPDQQGQVQYTGPASSFSCHLKLRTLFNDNSTHEFVLFGPNAAQKKYVQAATTIDPVLQTPPTHLVDSFFDRVHADFPVLHEPSFRAAYESSLETTAMIEDNNLSPSWMVTLLAVYILGNRAGGGGASEEHEDHWWQQIQYHLLTVIFTTNISAIQALLLVALHLHHTNHRDACWSLTGTAIRIAHAIGLHTDEAKTSQPPLLREMRKSLWWTLLAFEQLQISSYDRPSAMDLDDWAVSPPDERIVGMGSFYPPEFTRWSSRLTQFLANACRARRSCRETGSSAELLGPLSPTVAALRQLRHWREKLPGHLQPVAVQSTAPCYARPILLLGVQYDYAIVILTRPMLLDHAIKLSGNSEISSKSPDNETLLSDACRASGKSMGLSLISMHESGCFNSTTGFDFFYALTAAMCLILDIACSKAARHDHSETVDTLRRMSSLAQHYLHSSNVNMPGTLHKWATIISELSTMAQNSCSPLRPLRPHRFDPAELHLLQIPAVADAQLLMSLQEPHPNHDEAPTILPTTSSSCQHISSPVMPGMGEARTSRRPDLALGSPLQGWYWGDIETMLNE